LEIDGEQVVAAHARLSRHARGDDDDVGALDVGIGVGGLVAGIEALDRARLPDVEALAARNALDDVEEDDVAQILEAAEMRARAADHAGADESDPGARHGLKLLDWIGCPPMAGPAGARRLVVSSKHRAEQGGARRGIGSNKAPAALRRCAGETAQYASLL